MTSARRPLGHAPRGDAVTVTNDRASFQVTDLRVGGRLPAVAPGTRTFRLRG